MAELKRLCEPDEDGDEATTIDAVIASIADRCDAVLTMA